MDELVLQLAASKPFEALTEVEKKAVAQTMSVADYNLLYKNLQLAVSLEGEATPPPRLKSALMAALKPVARPWYQRTITIGQAAAFIAGIISTGILILYFTQLTPESNSTPAVVIKYQTDTVWVEKIVWKERKVVVLPAPPMAATTISTDTIIPKNKLISSAPIAEQPELIRFFTKADHR